MPRLNSVKGLLDEPSERIKKKSTLRDILKIKPTKWNVR